MSLIINDYTVLMSVYAKETKQNLSLSIESVLNQTLIPSEIVIVKDGILPLELDNLINDFKIRNSNLFKIIQIQKNVGLGAALNFGLKHCTSEYVGRMDSDDICFPNRFEEQMKFMSLNKNISVLGTFVEEFNYEPKDLHRFRKLPTSFSEVKSFAKFRNPLNHPTVVFKKEDILKVGSYMDMLSFEDYYLWVRLLKSGFKIANLPMPLLHFRIGNDMVGRRHGLSYMKKEINFLNAVRKLGFINTREYCTSLILKVPIRLLPKNALSFFYKKFLR